MGKDNLGDSSGSREPDPQAVPALTGFDPGRGIDPTEADIGRNVTYRGGAGEVEHGYITSFNDSVVFVRYGMGCTSQATSREDLEWG